MKKNFIAFKKLLLSRKWDNCMQIWAQNPVDFVLGIHLMDFFLEICRMTRHYEETKGALNIFFVTFAGQWGTMSKRNS